MSADLSIRDLKIRIRRTLNGKWSLTVPCTLALLGGAVISTWVSSLLAGGTAGAIAMSVAGAFILELLLDLLSAGGSAFYLHLVREMPFSAGDLMIPFRLGPDRFLVAALVKTATEAVCVLPGTLALTFVSSPAPGAVLLAAGCAAAVYLRLTWSQTDYLLLQDPSLGGLAALSASAHLMAGRKAELFRCLLPFAGYALLVLLTLGAGLFWVSPYLRAVLAKYFDSITQ